MPLRAPDPPLADGIVKLRAPAERDLDVIERGIGEADFIRWFGRSTLSATEVLELNRTRWLERSGATFAICDTQDKCLGHVWVNLADGGRGSVGYWLLPEARGQGLASRSVRLVSRWALHDLGLVRLALFTEPSNEPSLRVAERCGFRWEGVLRAYAEVDGRRVDQVVFSLLPSDIEAELQNGAADPTT